jgi:hypothetical protein
MGNEEDKDKNLDQGIKERPFGLTSDEIILLAYVLEYDCTDGVHGQVAQILEKIENELHVDTYVGNRLSEHGRIMGWSKESS